MGGQPGESNRRHYPCRAALDLPGSARSLERDLAGTRAAVKSRAHAWTSDALARSRLRVPIAVEVREGDAATVLGQAAQGAHMLVLGMNAGTDHSELTEYAVPLRCEVVVVDERGRRTRCGTRHWWNDEHGLLRSVILEPPE